MVEVLTYLWLKFTHPGLWANYVQRIRALEDGATGDNGDNALSSQELAYGKVNI